jgi:pyrimidine oxygenase
MRSRTGVKLWGSTICRPTRGVFVGSYASVAQMLDEMATVPGVCGVMLTFDDFIIGMEQFGTRILPLMRCRSDVRQAA